MSETDRLFVMNKMAATKQSFRAANSIAEQQQRHRSTGFVWILRMIHALVDNDSARAAFMRAYDSLTRSQLDGRNNPATVRVCAAWQVISDYYNDPSFSPSSTIYAGLHEEFNKVIDLSYDCVKDFGELTPAKVKEKFSDMRCKLTRI